MPFLRRAIIKLGLGKGKRRKAASKKRQWLIPDEREIYESMREQGWGYSDLGKQALVPKSKGLSKKLGIAKGSRILFFAGCYGDWANALARDGNRVVYSDVSADMVRGIRSSVKGASFERTRVLEASQWPRRPNEYDWSVSFEPIPLQDEALHLVLMRSLLNKKGAKIIYSRAYLFEIKNYIYKVAKGIAKLYGARSRKKSVEIENIGNRGKRIERVTVITLETNEQARRKAWIDMQVLKAVRSERDKKRSKKIKLNDLLKNERIKRLKLSKEELTESLRRLEALSKLASYPLTVVIQSE